MAAYEKYGDPSETTINPTSQSSNGMLMDIDPNSNRYLMADWTGEKSWGADVDTVVNLYLVTAGKGDRRLVYTHKGGGFNSAQISPDGRYVLVNTYSVMSEPNQERHAIVLVDLLDALPPRTLGETIADERNSGGFGGFSIGCTFIGNGAYAGKVIISRIEGSSTLLQMINPANADVPLMGAEISASSGDVWQVRQQDDNGILLTGQDISGGGVTSSLTTTLTVVAISPKGPTTVTNLPVKRDFYPEYTGIEGGRMVYTGAERNPAASGYSQSTVAYSFPIDQLGSQVISPTLVFTQSYGSVTVDANPDNRLRLIPTPRLLVYVISGELRARTYDGAIDVKLDGGITRIYGTYDTTKPDRFWGYLH